MKTTSRRTQRDYSLAFKLAVVSQVEKGEMTYKQAQERYGIQGRSTVLVWLRKHGQLDWSKGIEQSKSVRSDYVKLFLNSNLKSNESKNSSSN